MRMMIFFMCLASGEYYKKFSPVCKVPREEKY